MLLPPFTYERTEIFSVIGYLSKMWAWGLNPSVYGPIAHTRMVSNFINVGLIAMSPLSAQNSMFIQKLDLSFGNRSNLVIPQPTRLQWLSTGHGIKSKSLTKIKMALRNLASDHITCYIARFTVLSAHCISLHSWNEPNIFLHFRRVHFEFFYAQDTFHPYIPTSGSSAVKSEFKCHLLREFSSHINQSLYPSHSYLSLVLLICSVSHMTIYLFTVISPLPVWWE